MRYPQSWTPNDITLYEHLRTVHSCTHEALGRDREYHKIIHPKYWPQCEFGRDAEDREAARRFVASFRESYPSLTVEHVVERIKHLRNGGKPENVIDMWLSG